MLSELAVRARTGDADAGSVTDGLWLIVGPRPGRPIPREVGQRNPAATSPTAPPATSSRPRPFGR